MVTFELSTTTQKEGAMDWLLIWKAVVTIAAFVMAFHVATTL
jgi:hypothetical protein